MSTDLPKHNLPKVLRFVARERVAQALLLTLSIILLLGLTRRNDDTGPKLVKFSWKACADVVVAGDSRTGGGVSPGQLKQFLPGMRILNYAFAGIGYGPEYLDAIEGVLNPDSQQKIIILGISPQSLTEKMAQNNSFLDLQNTYAFRSPRLAACCQKLLKFTAPIKMKDALGGRLVDPHIQRQYRHSHADGWTAAYDDPPLQDFSGYLRDAHNIFDNNPVSPDLVKNLTNRVARWQSQGIHVYAFRMPTIPEMVAIENNQGEFDEQRFALAFEQAGGKWLTVDQFRYPSLDGSHLNRDGALEFSRDLGRIISARETSAQNTKLASEPQMRL